MSAFLDNTQINYVFFSSSPSSFSLPPSLCREKGGVQQKEEKPTPLFISLFLLWSFFFFPKEELDEEQRGSQGSIRGGRVLRDALIHLICATQTMIAESPPPPLCMRKTCHFDFLSVFQGIRSVLDRD